MSENRYQYICFGEKDGVPRGHGITRKDAEAMGEITVREEWLDTTLLTFKVEQGDAIWARKTPLQRAASFILD